MFVIQSEKTVRSLLIFLAIVFVLFVCCLFGFFIYLFIMIFVCLFLLPFPGETWQQKLWEYDGSNGLDSIRSKMQEAGAKAIVISKLDEVACEYSPTPPPAPPPTTPAL